MFFFLRNNALNSFVLYHDIVITFWENVSTKMVFSLLSSSLVYFGSWKTIFMTHYCPYLILSCHCKETNVIWWWLNVVKCTTAI